MTETIRLAARKAKSGEPYEVKVGRGHELVLNALNVMGELTDSELTFLLELHMAAPRRCELRDAGKVERAGSKGGSMTWRITDAGRELLAKLRTSAVIA